jgi:Holliday junction resolvasome RuvABC endonuclease subunit
MFKKPKMGKDRQALAELKNEILKGKMLAIDPSSSSRKSKTGFAYFEKGEIVESGTIDIDYKKHISERLDALYDFLRTNYYQPDALVIERIRGSRSHIYLHWAVGISIAAILPKYMT